MSNVTAEMVKQLREQTGAGMMDCKTALVEAGGNMEKAVLLLREKGLAAARRKAGREATEGLVDAYVHPGGRVGVLIEVNCETDFVARTPEFAALVRDLAMQVAAARPLYVSREAVPPEVVEREREIYRKAAAHEGKPAHVLERIVAGRLEKFYAEVCLLDQAFIKDPGRSVGQVVQEAVARLGENITVRRFVRYERGEAVGGD